MSADSFRGLIDQGEIESGVVEDESVEWVLQRIVVQEQPIAFDALMNPRQTEVAKE